LTKETSILNTAHLNYASITMNETLRMVENLKYNTF